MSLQKIYEVQENVKQWFSEAAGAFLEVMNIHGGTFKGHGDGGCSTCIQWTGARDA